MFDSTQENYTSIDYKIELPERAQLYHNEVFPIPKVHEETIKIEIDRLVNLAVLKKPKYNSVWVSFLISNTLVKEL